MCNKFSTLPLIGLLEAALNNPIEKSKLLQQPENIRKIMNNIPARQWLFEQAYQINDLNRAKQTKDFIIAMMKSSRLIWYGGISPDVYDEALSRTWVWFVEDFGEYNPDLASFVTWFNQKLKWKIQDVIREIAEKRKLLSRLKKDEEIRVSTNFPVIKEKECIDPPAPEPNHWHETIQKWLELVQGTPRLRDCRMQNHPHVNCQVLLIYILEVLRNSGEFSWNAIAQNYEVEQSALRRFCKTQCFSGSKNCCLNNIPKSF